jgi:peptidoglycan/LPS O-acetylase OafA/YrhL/lysophospholipase L1-like esterase
MVATPEVGISSRPASRPEPARLGYQPALDGLRAVAAGSVLLYHGGVNWSSGGFLGVDVFFVLSGFLITSLLVSEYQITGGIAIVKFYGRRIRRLFPALLLVLAAVIVYAATLAPVSQLRELRGDVVATLGYVENWRLVLTNRGYFDLFAIPSPLKHTWSLAVEEQWYLIWPIVVVGVLRITRRPRAGLGAALALTATLCVASTLWMIHLYTPGADPSRVYYGTDTRAQELLAGAVLAFLCAIVGRFTVSKAWRTAVRAGGALALLWVLYLFADVNDRTTWLYQGGLLLFSFVVAFVILAAIQPRGIVRTVLSIGWLRWLGTISYGLYLWHWPIYVACTRSRMHASGTALLLIRLALTLAAATASYYLVERPIRTRQFTRRQLFTAVPAVIVGTVVAVLVVTSGAPPSQADTLAALAQQSSQQKTKNDEDRGTFPISDYTAATTPPPTAPPGVDATKIVFTGDSVSYTLSTGLGKVKGLPPELVFDRSILGCSIFAGDRIAADGVPTNGGTQCPAWRANRQRWLTEFRPDVVAVLSGVWDVYDREVDGRKLAFGTPEFDQWYSANLDAFIAEMSSTGARVALLEAPCNARPDTVTGEYIPENDGARIDHLNALYRAAARRHPDTTSVIDLHGFLCPGGKFQSTLDGVTMRIDGVHLSPEGAHLTGKWLMPKLQALADRN